MFSRWERRSPRSSRRSGRPRGKAIRVDSRMGRPPGVPVRAPDARRRQSSVELRRRGWGMKDPAFGRYLGRWRGVFERAEVVELPDCGHAPPEERAPEALKRLAPFLER